MPWSKDQIAQAPTAQLMSETDRTPETLYEMNALTELARRALRGEASLDQVIRRVVQACDDKTLLFGAPPGYLAAHVLVTGPRAVKSEFWRMAGLLLDRRSVGSLRRQYPDDVAPPTRPSDSESEEAYLAEKWTTKVYGRADEAKVLQAVMGIAPSAALLDRWDGAQTVEWTFEFPPPTDEQLSLAVAEAVANATGKPASCDIPSKLGELGPDVVAFCRPGEKPALGTVEMESTQSVTFTPLLRRRTEGA